MKEDHKGYGLSVTFDFTMDLMGGAFDRCSLRRLFALYQSWGFGRVDWLYQYRRDDGYHTNYWLYDNALDNARRTYESLGELLPAAAGVAHELGMTCHAVFNPFDRAFNHNLYRPTQGRFGLMGAVDGGVARATRSFLKLKRCRMERNMRLLPDNVENMVIGKILLQSDSDAPHHLTAQTLRLETSPDNDTYRPYSGPVSFVERSVRGRRIIELRGLAIRERYVALRTPFEEGDGSFANTLDRLVRLYDPDGREIPFTYGLNDNAVRYSSFARRRRHLGAKIVKNAWQTGYLFEASGDGISDGFLKLTRRALDGAPGYVAVAKGKARYTPALSASYPEVRALWLRQIRECLEAGVDGVDIRIDNHARSQEWEAYGFEAPASREYRRRWGVDPRRANCDLRRLRQVRAEHFTEFIRQASRTVRAHDRRFHAHILSCTMRRKTGGRYMGMEWEWEKWLSEGLLDGVTMKGLNPEWPEDGARLCAALNRRAAAAQTPIWYCANFNVLGGFPDWPTRFKKLWAYSRSQGHAGMNIYESAELARKRGNRFHVHHPELPGMLSALMR